MEKFPRSIFRWQELARMALFDQCGGRMSVAEQRTCDNPHPLRGHNGADRDRKLTASPLKGRKFAVKPRLDGSH
jgi:hypothetical protein